MIRPKIEMIWSQSVDRDPIIGIEGQLPWQLPEDLQHFKKVTLGGVVIMGRKTWQSLPKKPLPDRTNVILTRNKDFQVEGADVVHDLSDSLELYSQQASKLMIIGGGKLLVQAMTMAQRLHVTEVGIEVRDVNDEHVLAPTVDDSWKLVGDTSKEELPWLESATSDLQYRFLIYERDSSLVL